MQKKVLKSGGRSGRVCVLHGVGKGKWQSFAGADPVDEFSYKMSFKGRECVSDFQKDFKKFVVRNAKKGRRMIGYFSYDLGYELHEVKRAARDDLRLPDVYFLAFDKWMAFKKLEELKEFKFVHDDKKNTDKKNKADKNFKLSIKKSEYKKAYNKIKNHIKAGDFYQINLTHRLTGESNMDSREFFLKVAEKNPVGFLAYIEGPGFEVLSASPERFVKVSGQKIETCPVKGTRPRGENLALDKAFRDELLASEKEEAELNMITDLLRNDLGKVCKIGSVKVAGRRLLSKCPTVWHTYSKIVGTVEKGLTSIDVLISMLPGGSITGCPKKRTIEAIDNLEKTTRGIYTGVIGFIEPNLDLDFNIAIRTIVKKGKKLYLQVGGGIVFDSDCEKEFQETHDKAKSFMNILK